MIPYQGRHHKGTMNARIIDAYASLQSTVHKFYYYYDDNKHLDALSKLTAW